MSLLATNSSVKVNLLKSTRQDVVKFFYDVKRLLFQERKAAIPHPLDYRRYDQLSQFLTNNQIMHAMWEYQFYAAKEKKPLTMASFAEWLEPQVNTYYSNEYSLAHLFSLFGPQKHGSFADEAFHIIERKENSWFLAGGNKSYRETVEKLNEIVQEYYS
jgi:hypothetical protein